MFSFSVWSESVSLIREFLMLWNRKKDLSLGQSLYSTMMSTHLPFLLFKTWKLSMHCSFFFKGRCSSLLIISAPLSPTLFSPCLGILNMWHHASDFLTPCLFHWLTFERVEELKVWWWPQFTCWLLYYRIKGKKGRIKYRPVAYAVTTGCSLSKANSCDSETAINMQAIKLRNSCRQLRKKHVPICIKQKNCGYVHHSSYNFSSF